MVLNSARVQFVGWLSSISASAKAGPFSSTRPCCGTSARSRRGTRSTSMSSSLFYAAWLHFTGQNTSYMYVHCYDCCPLPRRYRQRACSCGSVYSQYTAKMHILNGLYHTCMCYIILILAKLPRCYPNQSVAMAAFVEDIQQSAHSPGLMSNVHADDSQTLRQIPPFWRYTEVWPRCSWERCSTNSLWSSTSSLGPCFPFTKSRAI